MSKEMKRFGKWASLCLLFIFTCVCSGVLAPQPAEAAVTVEQAKAAGKRIATSRGHSLALKADGSVVAWGDNGSGQCTVPAEAQSGVVSIAAGRSYSLALKEDGTVVTWGWCSEEIPVSARSGVVDIVAGETHFLALKADGSVVAWGNNGSGQCTVPAEAQSSVVSIAAGTNHSMALKADGTVVIWGSSFLCDVPEGLSNVVAIDAGFLHSIALKADGTVVAWGGYEDDGPVYVPDGLNNVVAISACGSHDLALKADGTIVAWGENYCGESNVPPEIQGSAVAIAAGFWHSMALKSDGTVYAWGLNVSGQCTVPAGLNLAGSLTNLTISSGTLSPAFDKDTLNYIVNVGDISSINITATLESSNNILTINGEHQTSGSPKTVALEPGPNSIRIDVDAGGLIRTYKIIVNCPIPNGALMEIAKAAGKRIATSRGHSLALKADGSVVAWGDNSSGQCTVPAEAQSGVVSIAAGTSYSMALKEDGTVVTWGWCSEEIPVSARSGVVDIVAGETHFLALKADGSVVAWGNNGSGQCTVPAEAQSSVVSIAAGTNHSMALKADGTVVAWGENYFGQCTVPLEAQSGVVAVSAGFRHSMVLKSDGTVVAWGEYEDDGSAYVPEGLSNVVAISAGGNHDMALKADGTIVAWGENYCGESNVPPEIQGSAVAIAAGFWHSMALKSDGTVYAWGLNNGQCDVPDGLNLAGSLTNLTISSGTLSPAFDKDTLNYIVNVGDISSINITATLESSNNILTINGEHQTSGSPKTVALEPGPNSIRIDVDAGGLIRTYKIIVNCPIPNGALMEIAKAAGKRIATSRGHSLALKADGSVVAWGDNGSGQCTVPAEAQSSVVSIAAGTSYSLALKEDGTVVTWGRCSEEIPVSARSGVVDIVAGETHFLALKADGSVVAWGNNGSGQCTVPAEAQSSVVSIAAGTNHSMALKADGTVVIWGSSFLCDVPEGLSNVVAIDAGFLHSIALKADGTVVAWGEYEDDGPVYVPDGLNNVVAISACGSHDLALKADGTIVAWGENYCGESNVPPEIQGSAVAIAAGFWHSMALKSDGTVYAWGLNVSGQCTVPAGLNLAGSLTNLTISSGTLSPAFDKDTYTYTASVGDRVNSLNVTATVEAGAQLYINGVSHTSGQAKAVPLNVGSNTIKIEAKIAGTTRTYTLTVTRAASNVNLSGLSTSPGTLSPAFAASTTNYTVTLTTLVNSISVTATPADSGATVKINGTGGVGAQTVSVPIKAGENSIPVVITGWDGVTKKTYTIKVIRPSAVTALTISSGTLSPGFSQGTLSYTASVGDRVNSLNVTATVEAGAQLYINGVSHTSGTAKAVPLKVGSNTIKIEAKIAGTTRTYTLTVTRAASNVNLSGLSTSPGTLSPAFAASTSNYTVTLTTLANSISVTATPADSGATVKINGTGGVGAQTVSVPIKAGENSIPVVITGWDGVTKKTYTIKVIRPSAVTALTISSGTLSPGFSQGTLSYTASVGDRVNSLNVTATVEAGAQLYINGVSHTSGTAKAVPLNVGSNKITIEAKIAGTTRTYTLTVTRAASNVNLSGLSTSPGTLSPAFAAGTTNYTVTLTTLANSISVTATPADSGASIKINGQGSGAGAQTVSVPIKAGENSIPVVITGWDGVTKKTYTIKVIRPSAVTALTISSGTLSPGFSQGTLSYTASVGDRVNSLNVTATVEAGAQLYINGVSHTSGTAKAVPLNVGSNKITIEAKIAGTTRTYTLTVTRAASNVNLSGLSTSPGTLSPAFAASTSNYTVTLTTLANSISVTATPADSGATVKINGTGGVGAQTVSVPIKAGENSIPVVITGWDGVTKKTYTIKVIRPSAVTALTISSGTLSPGFSQGTLSYTASVGDRVNSLNVTATVEAGAQLYINGVSHTSGTAKAVPLNVGSNKITIEAKIAGTTRTYTLTVTRAASNVNLSGLSTSPGTLSPAFAASTTNYTVTLTTLANSISVTATPADSGATVKINGTGGVGAQTVSVPIKAGENSIPVVITGWDGVTKKTYTIKVIRPSAVTALTISSGALAPGF
ncbi:MAG: cadherin-like beta sandwich domain-containing protein [Peptococcia bacterium]